MGRKRTTQDFDYCIRKGIAIYILKKTGKTQSEIGTLLGVDQSLVSKWMSGPMISNGQVDFIPEENKRAPSFLQLMKISAYMYLQSPVDIKPVL